MSLPDSVGLSVETPFDVLILGGSHAGLAAAATLYRHQHTMAIFDDGKPRNAWATTVRVLPNWEGKNQEQIRELSQREIAASGLARMINEQVTNVTKQQDGSGFQTTTSTGTTYFGRKLLVATGAEFIFPQIEGYAELFPERM
jgi:thioredoxin reductase